MEVVPSIDISQGKCVRLFKGKKGTEKIYYEDPIEALNFWINQGAHRLHIIDLDGAWGSDTNKNLLKRIISRFSDKIKIQVGGGIRSFEEAVELIEIGANRIILGTLAINQPNIIKELAREIGSEHIIVALDYMKEKIATHGWTIQTNKDPFTFGKEVVKLGAGFIIFSSIEADGAYLGPDMNNIKRILDLVDIPVYVAGGIRNEKDLWDLKNIGVYGVIVGKAFYDK
ncbi:MAG: 1-(5-phosphoribosyl)-5-[(5-phosphoribosylamino)methylideneamino]imidazole-4-carboxamide isomerase, partial [Promethearchaeota archaeon]